MGVDPGLDGGLAFYCTIREALRDVQPMPVFPGPQGKRVVNSVHLRDILLTMLPDRILIETVGARPGQGVTSMFSFGRGLGRVEGVCAALRLPVEYVTPQTWRGRVKLRAGKDGARELATRLFPEFGGVFAPKGADGLAEAALIALAGSRA